MNDNAFNKICGQLRAAGADFRIITHTACRTSAESGVARASGGAPSTVGAKAILCKLYFGKEEAFAVFVMPGSYRLDTQAVKANLPGLKKIRFASSEEMLSLCGVLPGCMPPFGKTVFPGVDELFVETAVAHQGTLGFNAADFCRSVVVSAADYIKAVADEARVINFAKQEETDADPA